MIELSIYQRNNSAVKQTNNNKTNQPNKQTKKPKPSNHLCSDTNKQPGSSEMVI